VRRPAPATRRVEIAAVPGARWIAGGTFDDPDWIKPRVHAWTDRPYFGWSFPLMLKFSRRPPSNRSGKSLGGWRAKRNTEDNGYR